MNNENKIKKRVNNRKTRRITKFVKSIIRDMYNGGALVRDMTNIKKMEEKFYGKEN